MPVLFLMLITVLNDGTLITVAYDNVNPSKVPEKWHLKALWCAASALGAPAATLQASGRGARLLLELLRSLEHLSDLWVDPVAARLTQPFSTVPGNLSSNSLR
jgi:hypothetical protein